MLEAGKLNRRITIQALQVVEDPAYGPQPAAWVEMATVWAEIQDALPSKSESVQQGLVISYSRTRIRMRYRAGITSAMRVVEVGGAARTFNIVGGPSILGNRKGIELMCEAYSSQGGA